MGNHQNFTGKTSVDAHIDKTVTDRYAIGRRIGRGCYGVVYMAHKLTRHGAMNPNEPCAIKKVISAFGNASDAQKVYREVMYLKEVQGHENIVILYDVIRSDSDRHFYLIFELLDSSLRMALNVRAIQKIHRPYIGYQILRGLKYIHSAGIMHRDVTPANILLTKACDVKIADFGWCRSSPMTEEDDDWEEMSNYGGTRWYRSPEVVFEARYYTTAIDVWAVGCIVAEMFLNRALLPGTSSLDMIERMIELMGKPSPHDIVSLGCPGVEQAMQPVAPGPPHRSLEVVFPNESRVVRDFLHVVLLWNPMKRLTANEALAHPFLGAHHNPDDEPTFGRQVKLPLSDNVQVELSWYRDQLYSDILHNAVAKARIERHIKDKGQRTSTRQVSVRSSKAIVEDIDEAAEPLSP